MKRMLAAAAITVFAIMPIAAQADPGPEGCAVLAGQGEAAGSITEVGAGNGIVGGGSWTVTIARGSETIVISRTHAVPEVIQDVFLAGDQVSCVADEGFVVAGKAV